MVQDKLYHLTARINLKNIKSNFNLIKKKSLSSEVGAVVKANAYGLGVSNIVPLIEELGCRNFFVSSLQEALEIKEILTKNSRIFVLHGAFKEEIHEIFANNFIPVVNNREQLQNLLEISSNFEFKLPCVLNFNLSMYRLGLMEDELDQILFNNDLSSLNIVYIMGHLSSSDNFESQANAIELAKFNSICSRFSIVTKKTLANSHALKLGKKYLFDLVRTGAAIYGITKFSNLNLLDSSLKEVLSIYSHIIQINKISKDQFVGYNGTFKTTRETIVAVIPIGYADGYVRNFSNNASVYIEGFIAPVIGSVSMDLTIIDVTSVPGNLLFLGQKVEIIGPNQSIYSLARISKTISYEILTIFMLGRRIKRFYINH